MLEKLTEKQREAFDLYYVQGYTMQEIADRLHIGKDSVKDRLYGAMKKLQRTAKKH